MEKQENNYDVATLEMVERLIETYYSSDFQVVESMLRSIAEIKKAEVDVDAIVADTIESRERLADNVSQYEEELVRMLDLSTALLEYHINGSDIDMEPYINYLLKKNTTILPDIIEVIQLLKK